MVNMINLILAQDIVVDEFESRIVEVMHNVLLSTTKEIINNNHIVSPLQDPFNQMDSHKSTPLPPSPMRTILRGCLLVTHHDIGTMVVF